MLFNWDTCICFSASLVLRVRPLYVCPFQYFDYVANPDNALLRWNRITSKTCLAKTSGVEASAELHERLAGYAHIASARLRTHIW